MKCGVKHCFGGGKGRKKRRLGWLSSNTYQQAMKYMDQPKPQVMPVISLKPRITCERFSVRSYGVSQVGLSYPV